MDRFLVQQNFVETFGRFEHRLKREGHVRLDRADAQADWRAFAQSLGEDFFAEVRRTGVAETLIAKPPGRLLRNLEWQRPIEPLNGVKELFEKGVCRVRNSAVHGEKFVGEAQQMERDFRLMQEALAVLNLVDKWRLTRSAERP